MTTFANKIPLAIRIATGAFLPLKLLGLLQPNAVGEALDTEISDSAFGKFISIGRGRIRVSGDLIWAREIIVKKKTSGGGKKPKTKTFTYFLDGIYLMADASTFGPAKEIVKVWADTELIFDSTGEQELDVKDDVTLRFKLGTEEQSPDIMQIEDEGVLAQGFPFSVTIILDRFPLKYTGDRPPSLTAEIDFEKVEDGSLTFEKEGDDNGTDNPSIIYLIDYSADRIYAMEGPSGPWTAMREYDLNTLNELDIHDLTILPLLFGSGQAMELRGIDQNTGYLFGWHGYNPNDSENFNTRAYVYDPATKTLITDVNFREAVFGTDPTDAQDQHFPYIRSSNGLHSAVASTDFGSFLTPNNNNILSFPSLTHLHNFIGPEPGVEEGSPLKVKWKTGSANAAHGDSKLWICWVSFDNIIFSSYELTNTNTIITTQFAPISRTILHATKIFNSRSINWNPYINLVDNTIIVNLSMEDSGGGGLISIIFKWDEDTNTILWSNTLPVREQGENNRGNTRLEGDFLVLYGEFITNVYLIDLADGSFTTELTTLDDHIVFGSANWDGRRNRLYTIKDETTGPLNKFRTFRITKPNIGNVDLDEIIREICVRVGLVEGIDFDVSAVTGSVWGWKIINRIKANEALGNILGPFFLQAGIQDGLINFITRNEISQVTINVGEFLQDPEDEESLPYLIMEEDEASLPSEVNIGFVDPARDYESGNASYRRPNFPDSPVLSHEKLNVGIPFALTPVLAKNIAYKLTYIPWLERETIKGKLDWTYIKYNVNDIVTFNFGDGVLKKARIIKSSILADWTLDIEAIFLEPGASQAATFAASSGDFDRVSSIEPSPDTVQHILDINLLRDVDDLAQAASLGYVSAGPKNPPNKAWFGAAIHRSFDQIDYEQIADTFVDGIFGTTNEIFNTPTDPFGTKFDDTLDVLIPSGKGTELANVTYQSFLNSGNPFIIIKSTGHEICQFQNVTNLGGNVFRLSILARGQRGTDTQVGNNTLRDLIIFPTVENMEGFSVLLSNIGDTAFFRAVSSGQLFNDANDLIKIMTGNDLKPYAPVNFVAFREGNDDLTITFNRRTRVGAGIVNGEWRSPLNEAISSFEVDLYDATGVTINRTLASATESFTYLSANQTTDGLSLSATTVWIAIYQLSDIVGRGYFYKLETLVT